MTHVLRLAFEQTSCGWFTFGGVAEGDRSVEPRVPSSWRVWLCQRSRRRPECVASPSVPRKRNGHAKDPGDPCSTRRIECFFAQVALKF